MKIVGLQNIQANQQKVWDALFNPEILKNCLPGCESVEMVNSNLFKVAITMTIGPLKAKFLGTLTVQDAQAPNHCTLIFEGQGGAIGFGKGSAKVDLKSTPEGTELAYEAQANVGGKLAQIGSRLIDSVAKKLSDDFFKAFNHEISPKESFEIQPTEQVTESTAQSNPSVASKISVDNETNLKPSSGPLKVPASWLIWAACAGSGITLLIGMLTKS